MNIKLTRMEGLGNRFVIALGPLSTTKQQVIEFCSKYSKKEKADGFLVATPIDAKTVRMQYWNVDGSPAEMCGNGLRCLAKFAQTMKLVNSNEFAVRTDAGDLQVRCDLENEAMVEAQIGKVTITQDPVVLYGEKFYEASVGNPHAVTFVNDITSAPVTTLGSKVEIDACFPNKTNVEFLQVTDKSTIALRTWERGVGETQACGTAMAAASAVFIKMKKGSYPVTVKVPGGNAKLWVDDSGFTRMLALVAFV